MLEKELPINFIISAGEEVGCVGIKLLEDHKVLDKIEALDTWCIVLDRRGCDDVLDSGSGSTYCKTLAQDICNYLGDMSVTSGSVSDTATICEYCESVNMSVAYMTGPTGIGMAKLNADSDAGTTANNYTFTVASAATDIQYKFPTGWDELWGIHNRTDYDLSQHSKFSGKDLSYLDPETNEKYIPYVVEPSVGVERLLLAVLTDAYEEEVLEGGETREVLHLHPALAPVKIAVLPLVNKLNEKATEVFKLLSRDFICEYDTSGKIGKRYRRQDSIGTPYCVTVDFDTLEKGLVTVRHRDSMKQDVVAVEDLKAYFTGKFDF